jgi:uncharacterized DUF497 family protein
MPYWEIIWTPEIEDHLAQHGVSPEEFATVVRDPWSEETSRSSGDPIAFGETQTGRTLACVYRVLEDGITIEPVTAYDVDLGR